MEGGVQKIRDSFGKGGNLLKDFGATWISVHSSLGGTSGLSRSQGPSFFPVAPWKTGHPHPFDDGKPTRSLAISHRYDLIRLWMNKERGKRLGLTGWGLGEDQIDGRGGKDSSPPYRRYPSLLCLASERIWDLFETFKDGLRCRVILQ